MKQEKLPTIDDVANLAGVSTATVSRALNAPDTVRENTRIKVNSAIDALGYTPNFGGRALASNSTGTIGAVIPTMDNAIFAEAMQALEEALADNGMTLFISTSQYSPEREALQIRSLLARGVDGLVLIGSEARGDIDELIKKRNLPCVNIWTAKPRVDRVTIGFNNEVMAYNLTKEICKLGHVDIAVISGILDGNGRAQGRVRGIRRAMSENGIELKMSHLIECKYSFENGKKACQQLLSQSQRPTVIICGNDVLAIGALQYARGSGIKIPEDLSITGFDDLEISHVISPALTTVRVPHRRMGRAAAESLLNWFEHQQKPEDITFTADIIWRESLGRRHKNTK